MLYKPEAGNPQKAKRLESTLKVGLHADDAYLLAELLRSNPAIEALLLNVNHLSDRGVKILGEALSTNTTLTELGLASNGISDRGCELLISAIQNMSRLSRLDLGYSPSTRVLGANPNAITERGLVAIANYLTTNQTLSHLDLRGAKLDDRSQSLLVDALTNN
jgi:Ran GTPase-activating protein (RanGAP) involved in mRNA processing and transport